MAQGDATRLACGDLNQANTTALQAMLTQADGLRNSIKKLLEARRERPQAPIASLEEPLGAHVRRACPRILALRPSRPEVDAQGVRPPTHG